MLKIEASRHCLQFTVSKRNKDLVSTNNLCDLTRGSEGTRIEDVGRIIGIYEKQTYTHGIISSDYLLV